MTLEKQMQEIVKYVINREPAYESEYGGRMERWCFFCDKYQEPRKSPMHEPECIWLKAQGLKQEVK